MKLIVGWFLFFVLIVAVGRFFWDAPNDRPQTAAAAAAAQAAAADNPTQADSLLIESAAPMCTQTLSGFLAATTPEEKNQFVLSPIKTASRMANYYSTNPMVKIEPESLDYKKTTVLRLPGKEAIEVVADLPDGHELEAVFVNENGDWRLDWDHFVRFSDYPWSLFLAGSGVTEGEFRLLARERLADERKSARTISMVLYAPKFGSTTETGFQSPEFLIERNSEDGRMLEAAFKSAKKSRRAFGMKDQKANPEELVRLRVIVKRIDVEMERRFEIVKIVACHWYSDESPGFTPVQPRETK